MKENLTTTSTKQLTKKMAWEDLAEMLEQLEGKTGLSESEIAELGKRLSNTQRRLSACDVSKQRQSLLKRGLAKMIEEVMRSGSNESFFYFVRHVVKSIDRTPSSTIAGIYAAALLAMTNPERQERLCLPPKVLLLLAKKIKLTAQQEKEEHTKINLVLLHALYERQARKFKPTKHRALYAAIHATLARARNNLPQGELKIAIHFCDSKIPEKDIENPSGRFHIAYRDHINSGGKDLYNAIARNSYSVDQEGTVLTPPAPTALSKSGEEKTVA